MEAGTIASTFINILAVVLSFGFGTWPAAIGPATSGPSRRDRYRFGAAFAIAEGTMPRVGFLVGA